MRFRKLRTKYAALYQQQHEIFVVKVDENEKKLPGIFKTDLNFIQFAQIQAFAGTSGMANADGAGYDRFMHLQKGRIETTNYRNVELPTGKVFHCLYRIIFKFLSKS
jgi:hypothetical protein